MGFIDFAKKVSECANAVGTRNKLNIKATEVMQKEYFQEDRQGRELTQYCDYQVQKIIF